MIIIGLDDMQSFDLLRFRNEVVAPWNELVDLWEGMTAAKRGPMEGKFHSFRVEIEAHINAVESCDDYSCCASLTSRVVDQLVKKLASFRRQASALSAPAT